MGRPIVGIRFNRGHRTKVFLSSKPEVERKQKFSEWQNEFGVELDFLNFITSESKQLEYANSGMPNDSLSLENASAVLGFIRPTFILDQSGRSQAFIKPGFLFKFRQS